MTPDVVSSTFRTSQLKSIEARAFDTGRRLDFWTIQVPENGLNLAMPEVIIRNGAHDKPICWKSGLEPDTGRAPYIVSNLRISRTSGNHDRSRNQIFTRVRVCR